MISSSDDDFQKNFSVRRMHSCVRSRCTERKDSIPGGLPQLMLLGPVRLCLSVKKHCKIVTCYS